LSVRRAGLEPARPAGHGVTDRLAQPVPADAFVPVARVGVEPTRHRGLSSAAVPIRVPRHIPAPCTGVEPVSPARQAGRHPGFVTGQFPSECLAGVEPARPPWEGSRLPLPHRHTVRPAGLEPARPPSEGGMRPLHHGRIVQSTRQESNLRDRRTRTAGCRYITSASVQSTWRESNPRLRLGMPACSPLYYRCFSSPASRGGRIRTHTGPFWRRPCCRYTTPLFSEARGT
jgi:hypothetical protein